MKTCQGSRRLDSDLVDMAKKVFQKRLNASLCAVYEDISEDEFEPTEIQLAELQKHNSYFTSFNPLYSLYGSGNIHVRQNYFGATPVFAASCAPLSCTPVEKTEDINEYLKTNMYDNCDDTTGSSTFEEDESKELVVKKEPEDEDECEEEESTISEETEQQLVDEYIKKELEEEYSEVEHSECEDVAINDASVKDELIVKDEEVDMTDNIVKKEADSEPEEFDNVFEGASAKVLHQCSAVPENVNVGSDLSTSIRVKQKILPSWSDISEDEAQKGVANDKAVNVHSGRIKHLKVNRSLFQEAPNINKCENVEPENLVKNNQHFEHSSDCECNDHSSLGSSYDYLFKRIPSVSYKATNYREKNTFSSDDLSQEKSDIPVKEQSSEMKISHYSYESRIDEHISSSKRDSIQTLGIIDDEPPKKREKLARNSPQESLKCTETICSPSRNLLHKNDDAFGSSEISSFSYPRMPYFFEEQKELLADPLQNEVTPSKTSPGMISAHHLKLLNCPLCTRKYWKENKLKEHMKMQHTERKVKKEETDRRYEISRCPECKEQLHTKVEMYVHRLTHLIPEFKKVKCPFCDHNQYSFDGLKEHVKTAHKLKEKWFCPICPEARTFTHRNSLLVHISTYHFDPAREAPSTFPCSKCNKVFSSKALLGKHINNHHLGPTISAQDYKMFKCDICGESYDKLFDLKKHMKATHMNNHVHGNNEDATNTDFKEKLKIFNKNLLNKLTPSTGDIVSQ